MNKYKIEKNIPLPGRAAKYPFLKMKVGDSFFEMDKTRRYSIYSCATNCGVKIAIRADKEGFRVWRIK